MKRTDMACDFLPQEEKKEEYVHGFTVTVNKELAEKLHRPCGKYHTVECRAVPERNRAYYGAVAQNLKEALLRFLPEDAKSILVIGLGNPHMTADSLGALTCRRLSERGLFPDAPVRVSVLTPSVVGMTGVESFDVAAGVVARTKPDAVLAVDSLASAAVSRIAAAFQLTDTGITPGSGVSNHRQRLCRETLGVPVLSLGVPLVVYASTIIEDATGKPCPDDTADTVGNLLVTPKDIDLYVQDCAEIMANAVCESARHV